MAQRLITILFVSVLLVMPVYGAKMVRVVDEDGSVTYQSAPSSEEGGEVEERDIESAEDPEDARLAMDRAILEWPVTIYSTEQCKTCDVIRKQLEKRKIPYDEKFPAKDVVVYNELQEVSGGKSIPVIVIGETVLTQYSYLALKQALTQAGYPKVGAMENEDEDES